MASGKHGFCHKHLLYLKFKNTFYLVSRLQPKWSPWQGLSPVGASSWGRDKRPRAGRNRSSDPCQYSRVPQQHHSVPLPAVGDRSLHRGHFPHGAGAAPGNACPGPWGTAQGCQGWGGAPASPPAQGLDCSGVVHLIFRSRIPFVPRLAEPRWCGCWSSPTLREWRGS